MHTYDYKVRFGDLSFGPYLHYSKFLDLTVQTMEEFSHRIDYPIESLTEAGNIPFATVVAAGDVEAYPRFEDTVRVESAPVSVGERTFKVHNRYRRRSDGHLFGTTTTVHAVIDPSGRAVSLPTAVRDRLSSVSQAFEASPAAHDEIDPASVERTAPGSGSTFAHQVTVWSPQLEAAGAAYYEDYFRLVAEVLERHLAANGPTLAARSEPLFPFKPVHWEMEFEAPTAYAETLEIVGTITDQSAETVTISYELVGADEETKGVFEIAYGCFDGENSRVPFSEAALEGLD